MKVLVEGHTYVAEGLIPGSGDQTIQFIHKQPKEVGSTELVTVSEGTTNEELISILLNRLNYLNNKFPSTHNEIAIANLQSALDVLNLRTRERIERGVEGSNQK